MARGLLAFKQSDVRRALCAARDAGYDVASYRIAKDGAVEVTIGKPAAEAAPASDDPGNPWDSAA